jgi:hypothetical protein
MVTASHNDDGWTEVGANRPLTFGPDEMSRGRAWIAGMLSAAVLQPSHPPADLPEHHADSRDA